MSLLHFELIIRSRESLSRAQVNESDLLPLFFSSSFSLLPLFFPSSPLTKLANHFSFSSTRIPLTSSSFFLSACDLMYPSERGTTSQLLNLGQSFSVQLSPVFSSFFSFHFYFFSSWFLRDPRFNSSVQRGERFEQWNRFVSQTCGHESDHFARLSGSTPLSLTHKLSLYSQTLTLLTNSHSSKKLNPFLLFDSERNPFSN